MKITDVIWGVSPSCRVAKLPQWLQPLGAASLCFFHRYEGSDILEGDDDTFPVSCCFSLPLFFRPTFPSARVRGSVFLGVYYHYSAIW